MFFDLKNKKVITFINKIDILKAFNKESLFENLQKIEEYTAKGYYIAGFLSYEAGCYFLEKEINHKKLETPLMHFEVFEKMKEEDFDITLKNFNNSKHSVYNIKYSQDKKDYLKVIKKLKQHLYNGDTYQINYTIRMHFKSNISPKDLFFQLCKEQQTEFACFLDFDDYSILSLSPELFLKKTNDILVSKPMKGTTKKTKNNQKTIDLMSKDNKILSENAIIVDLIRNDMSIIAEKNSVEVINPFEILTLKTVNQMISTIQCKIKNKTFFEIIKALFPCGSITGAPKIRTMQIISENENSPREIYCGAIGYIKPNNDFCFNVAIRTSIFNQKTNEYKMGIGSGILYEAIDEDEFEECILKSEFITRLSTN